MSPEVQNPVRAFCTTATVHATAYYAQFELRYVMRFILFICLPSMLVYLSVACHSTKNEVCERRSYRKFVETSADDSATLKFNQNHNYILFKLMPLSISNSIKLTRFDSHTPYGNSKCRDIISADDAKCACLLNVKAFSMISLNSVIPVASSYSIFYVHCLLHQCHLAISE